MSGYIYLLGSRNFQWYKIGKSISPITRVRDLGILLPFRIELFAVWKVSNHHKAEQLLHERYAARRINGEWFHLKECTVKDLMAEFAIVAQPLNANFCNIPATFPDGSAIEYKVKRKIVDPSLTLEERDRRKREAISSRKKTCVEIGLGCIPEVVQGSIPERTGKSRPIPG